MAEAASGRSPRISVLVPVFNLGSYVDEAVESVLAQSYTDFEILVVDDGSDDPETIRILQDLRRPHTLVFRTENRGLAAARNFLIDLARGDLLCALDADDRLHPHYFAKAVAMLDSDPGLTFVSSWVRTFGREERDWRQQRCDLPALLAEDTVMTASLVRRAAVVDVGGYDEKMPHMGDEDWDLWIRLVAAGGRGAILPETLFFYRRRGDSMGDRCVEGEVHLELVRYLFRKHEALYRRHLREVLRAKEATIGEYLSANDRMEQEIAGLELDLAARRGELTRLRERRAGKRSEP